MKLREFKPLFKTKSRDMMAIEIFNLYLVDSIVNACKLPVSFKIKKTKLAITALIKHLITNSAPFSL